MLTLLLLIRLLRTILSLLQPLLSVTFESGPSERGDTG